MRDLDKDTLYLLPGLLCDGTVWIHQREHLADLVDIRIADFRGIDSFEAMADSVLQDAPERFLLAGHSMGGRVALQIMNSASERVEKLALLDTGVHPRSEGEEQKRMSLVNIAEKSGMAAMAREWAPPMVYSEHHQNHKLMNSIFDMVERYSLDEYKGQIKALLNRPDATPFLKKVTCKTLVLCGRQDGWSPPQQHEKIAAVLPHAELVVVEHCGHMSTMEQPEQVTKAFRNWIQD